MSITEHLETAPERQGTHPAIRGWFGPLPSALLDLHDSGAAYFEDAAS